MKSSFIVCQLEKLVWSEKKVDRCTLRGKCSSAWMWARIILYFENTIHQRLAGGAITYDDILSPGALSFWDASAVVFFC